MNSLKIWRLTEGGKYPVFIPHDLGFFSGKFNCASLADDWEVPPAEIYRRSAPLADFVSWMEMAPVVSARAKTLITELVGNDVEFLEFHPIRKKPYFVMNVLRCEDLFDLDKFELKPTSDKFYFKDCPEESLPPIFKCDSFHRQIFVTHLFAEMIISNQLKGAILADPSENIWPFIVSGKSFNRYPGLIT